MDKNYYRVGSNKLKLFKTGLGALITDILYIDAWTKVLILALFVSVLTISFYLFRTCFWIVFHNFVDFKIISSIISRYIIVYKKILKRLTLDKKLLLKLFLSLIVCKQY